MSLAFFADFAQRPPMQPVVQEQPKDTKPPADTKPAADPKPPQDEEGAGGLPKQIATGEVTSFEVSPQGGEGLSTMAEQIHSGLTDDMKKVNSYDSIYNNLVDNAVQHNGFQRGTDNSVLPQQYQGNRASGRDLDLIYASDKFKVDLKPSSEALNTHVPPGTTLTKGGPAVVSKDGSAQISLNKDGQLVVEKRGSKDPVYTSPADKGKGDKAVFTQDGKIQMLNDKDEATGWSIDAQEAWSKAIPRPLGTVQVAKNGEPMVSPDQQTRVLVGQDGRVHVQTPAPHTPAKWADIYASPVLTDATHNTVQVTFNSDGTVAMTGADGKTNTFDSSGKVLTR